MNRGDADTIVEALQKNRLFSDEKIVGYLDAQGCLNDKDSLALVMLRMTAKGNTFLTFVRDKLLDVATTSRFVELVSELGRQNGWPISELVDLYKKDPSIAMRVYSELDSTADVKLATAMGFLLGGMGVVEPEELFELISSSKNIPIHRRIAFMVSLRFISKESLMPEKIVNFVVKNSRSGNPQLRWEAICTMTVAFNSSDKFGKTLERLALQDDRTRGTIASFSLMIVKKNPQYLIKLLETCATSTNPSVLSEVAQTLGSIAPDYPSESLKLVKSWTTKDLRNKIGLDWLLQQIGKGDAGKITQFLVKWIRNEKDDLSLMLDLPRYTSEIFIEHYEAIPGLVKRLNLKSKRQKIFVLNLLEQCLSELHDKLDRSKPFAKECYNILTEIAIRQGVNIKEVTKGISDPVMLCLALVDACKNRGREPNKTLAEENLRYFPNLVGMLGQPWFDDQVGRMTSHPLVSILSSAKVSKKKVAGLVRQLKKEQDPLRRTMIIGTIQNQFYPFAFLADLDWALSMFRRTDQGMGGIIERLKNSDEFFQTLSELQLAARIKTKYPVVLQYKVGTRPVDIKATIDGSDVLMEVFGGETGIKLKYLRTAVSLGNRAKKKILEKIDNQIKYVAGKTNLPIILAIDRSRAHDIDEHDVQNALEGSLAMRFVVDKVRGETLGAYPVRNKDSISDENPDAKLLSGILLIRNDTDDKTLRVKLFGKAFHNPAATRPLAPSALKALQDVVFR